MQGVSQVTSSAFHEYVNSDMHGVSCVSKQYFMHGVSLVCKQNYAQCFTRELTEFLMDTHEFENYLRYIDSYILFNWYRVL